MISGVVYLLRIFKMFHRLMNNPVYIGTDKLDGAWGGVVVKVLRYYSDGPGIDSRWCYWIFQ